MYKTNKKVMSFWNFFKKSLDFIHQKTGIGCAWNKVQTYFSMYTPQDGLRQFVCLLVGLAVAVICQILGYGIAVSAGVGIFLCYGMTTVIGLYGRKSVTAAIDIDANNSIASRQSIGLDADAQVPQQENSKTKSKQRIHEDANNTKDSVLRVSEYSLLSSKDQSKKSFNDREKVREIAMNFVQDIMTSYTAENVIT